MSLSWTTGRIAAAVSGVLVGDPDVGVSSVTTDSRHALPGSVFVALEGEHFDGNRYAAAAMAAGAVAAIVTRIVDDDGTGPIRPRIEVGDTGTALRDLASLRRGELAMPVVAVTGSTGKTATKDLLAAALPGAVASARSFNNEVGVPLTILGAPDDARHLVVEVGSRGVGHIEWLMPAVSPDVAVITNLGVAHLEFFGSADRLADAKWELVEALGARGTAVVPFGEPRLRRSHAGRTVTFGRDTAADVAVSSPEIDDLGRPTFDLVTPAGKRHLRLTTAGGHQALNAAAATAAGLALDVDLDTICAGLVRTVGSPWRMEIHRGRFTVVNDAYNANPDSVLAALETVASMPGRHVAVLGRMAELGPIEAEEHRKVGTVARRLGYAAVVTVGSDPGLATGAGDIAHATGEVDEAFDVVTRLIRPGDVVLVKASRAVGLEALAARLATEAAS